MTTALIKLKRLWQTTLTETEKAEWRQQLLTATLEDLRNLIHEKLNLNLQHDWQLAEFRQWEFEQRAHAIHDEWLMEQARRLLQDQNHPDGRAQEELLKQICLQTAFARQDYLALHAVRSAVRCSLLDLHRERFKESCRTKINAGLDTIREESKHNPALRAAVDNLRNVLATQNPDSISN